MLPLKTMAGVRMLIVSMLMTFIIYCTVDQTGVHSWFKLSGHMFKWFCPWPWRSSLFTCRYMGSYLGCEKVITQHSDGKCGSAGK